MLEIPLSVFWFMGSFNLAMMSFTDIRELFIDDRHNYFMMGVTVCLYFSSNRPITYLIAMIIMSTAFTYATKKFFAEGDLKVLAWELLFMGLMGPAFVLLFWVFLAIYLTVQVALVLLYRIQGKTAGLPVLSGAFWTVALIAYFF